MKNFSQLVEGVVVQVAVRSRYKDLYPYVLLQLLSGKLVAGRMPLMAGTGWARDEFKVGTRVQLECRLTGKPSRAFPRIVNPVEQFTHGREGKVVEPAEPDVEYPNVETFP